RSRALLEPGRCTMQSDYDHGAKYAAQRLDARGYLRDLLGGRLLKKWTWKGWLPTESVAYPGEPDRRADLIPWFTRNDGSEPPLAIVLEFMTRPRENALERLAEYTLRFHRELPFQHDPLVQYTVIGWLINLTGEMKRRTWRMQPGDWSLEGL